MSKAAKKLGILHFTWRNFRRSAESAMHSHEVSFQAQQTVLGHSDANLALVYAEINEAAKCQAVEDFGKLIFPKLQLPLQLERLTN